MQKRTRRRFLEEALKVSALSAFAGGGFGETPKDSIVHLSRTDSRPIEIPADFIGLGYEMSSVATPGLLSTTNRRYVELVKGLGAQGVLRVGGIVANYTRYVQNGAIQADKKDTVVNREALERFAAFLREIHWTAIWSLNFAQGTIEDSAIEAKAVKNVLGDRLLALEIGNEVDTYGRGQPFRPANYDDHAYLKEYRAWHAAIAKAVPDVRFAAPDTASALDWVEQLAVDDPEDVQLLTTHYYRAHQTRGSAEMLLESDPRLLDILQRMSATSRKSGIPWRLCEANSFSGGGLPGVSDSFLGALWTLDFLLLLAASRCGGVNLETGVNQLGFISSYSPIQDDGNGVNAPGAPYYGMLAFSVARQGCREMIPVALDSPVTGVTAYAMGASGAPRSAVLINRNSRYDAQISLDQLGIRRAQIVRLAAPSMESPSNIALGGASVDANGAWRLKKSEQIHDGLVRVPNGSAAIVRRVAP